MTEFKIKPQDYYKTSIQIHYRGFPVCKPWIWTTEPYREKAGECSSDECISYAEIAAVAIVCNVMLLHNPKQSY